MDEKAKAAMRAYKREWAKNNRDKMRAAQERYKERHPDRVKASDKKYRDNNPDKIRAANERYWMKKAQEMGPVCHHCGASFTAKRSDAKFCSTSCRVLNNRKQKSP